MTKVFYNEIDKYCCRWLENLMKAGEIPEGDIDGRDIRDIKPAELMGYTQCHFFAGLGGWPLALRLAGWPDSLPAWSGSCPCQPFSQAGSRKGLIDERHLWPSWFHLIDICGPARVLGEQVSAAIGHGWLRQVRQDMEAIGYAIAPVVLQAHAFGAKCKRERLWFVADSLRGKQPRQEPRSWTPGRVGRIEQPVSWDEPWESALRRFRAMDDGLSYGVAATDAIRNAIMPPVAAEFLRAYLEAQ